MLHGGAVVGDSDGLRDGAADGRTDGLVDGLLEGDTDGGDEVDVLDDVDVELFGQSPGSTRARWIQPGAIPGFVLFCSPNSQQRSVLAWYEKDLHSSALSLRRHSEAHAS